VTSRPLRVRGTAPARGAARLAVAIAALTLAGCSHRVEPRRSPFIKPLPEGTRPAIAAPEGAPADPSDAAPGPDPALAADGAAARALRDLQVAHAAAGFAAGAAAGESEAVRAERARVAASPRSAAARLGLARAYHHERILDLAIEHYAAARELDPADPEIPRDLGRAWNDAGAPALALPLLDEAIRARPLDAESWSARGIALDLLGRYAEGEEALRRAAALEPRRWDFRNNLGYNLLLQGRRTEAAGAFREGLALAPGHPVLQNNLGLALGLAGDQEGALEAFRLAGSEAEAWNNLAVVQRALGDLEAAATSFERAADADPGSRAIARNLREARRALAAGGPAAAAAPPVAERKEEAPVTDALRRNDPPAAAAPASAPPRPPSREGAAPAPRPAPAAASHAPVPADPAAVYQLELLRTTWEDVAAKAAATFGRANGLPFRVHRSGSLFFVQIGEDLTLDRAEALRRAARAAGWNDARIRDGLGREVRPPHPNAASSTEPR
jgi:Flp pilus assembly protein TadD